MNCLLRSLALLLMLAVSTAWAESARMPLRPAFDAEQRAWLKEHGLKSVLNFYGTADLGSIAYESEAMEGMILDEELILEIVRPGTGDPLPDGEVGEVVITTLNPDYPLIRFATGDLSAVLPGISPCGRTNVRIRGWLGRADQTTKVRGIPRVQVFTPTDPSRTGAIANVGIGGMKPGVLASALMDRYRIFTVAINTAGVTGVRVTPQLFTTTAELDALVRAITELARG